MQNDAGRSDRKATALRTLRCITDTEEHQRLPCHLDWAHHPQGRPAQNSCRCLGVDLMEGLPLLPQHFLVYEPQTTCHLSLLTTAPKIKKLIKAKGENDADSLSRAMRHVPPKWQSPPQMELGSTGTSPQPCTARPVRKPRYTLRPKEIFIASTHKSSHTSL